MKCFSLLVILGTISLVLSSCAPSRRSTVGYGPYGIYPSYIYDDAPGGWDVFRARGGGARVKYSE